MSVSVAVSVSVSVSVSVPVPVHVSGPVLASESVCAWVGVTARGRLPGPVPWRDACTSTDVFS